MTDSEAQAPAHDDSSVAKFWDAIKEYHAQYLILGTAGLYLYTYFYKVAYLSYFGLPDYLASVSSADLVSASARLVVFVALFYNILVLVPRKAVFPGLTVVVVYWPFSLLFFLVLLMYLRAGFNRVSLGLSCVLLLYFAFLAFDLIRGVRDKGSFMAYLINDIDAEVRVRKSLVGTYIIDSSPLHVAISFLVLFFGSSALGGYWGAHDAGRLRDYQVLTLNDERLAVVFQSQEQLYAVKINEADGAQHVFGRGHTMIGLSNVSTMEFDVISAALNPKSTIVRAGFEDFVRSECRSGSIICSGWLRERFGQGSRPD